MKQIIRAFSAGLIAAGFIFLIGFYFSDTGSATEYNTEEMIQVLNNEGYHVLSEKEYISLSVGPTENDGEEKEEKANKKEEADADHKEENTEEKENDDKEEEKHTYTLKITEDMLSPDISKLLKENNIIDDATDFTNYLEEHDYSIKIQLGDFKLSSDMDYYQIAETITNYARGQ